MAGKGYVPVHFLHFSYTAPLHLYTVGVMKMYMGCDPEVEQYNLRLPFDLPKPYRSNQVTRVYRNGQKSLIVNHSS